MSQYQPNQFDNIDGYYGPNQDFGGQYVPELLLPALEELEDTFVRLRSDSDFLDELHDLYTNFIGRPSPLIHAKSLSNHLGGAQIYLKNEGNNLTGSHKINHCVYQLLLAKRMGKTRVICETGAGQHGIACATVCAKFGLECVVYMGAKDIQKQYPNVFFMKQMGAKVIEVTQGNQGLADAVDMALGEFMSHPDSYYMLGSAVGPHPYPEIMRESQKIISIETKKQLEVCASRLPDVVIACIGGGSNAIGAFHEYLYDESVRLVGVEAAGKGLTVEKGHASRLDSEQGSVGIMQGFKSYFLLDKQGQNIPTYSLAAGLNYAGIGPIHAYLHTVGRLEVVSATDSEVIEAFQLVAQKEGLIMALESSHAVVEAIKIAPYLPKNKIIVVNVSGRGDNYLFNLATALQDQEFSQFCHVFNLK